MFRALYALAALFLLATFPAAAGDVLSAPEAQALQQAEKLIIVDVRTPKEWRETGIPAGAKAVTLGNPDGPDAFADEVLKAAGGNKAAPLGVICRSGNRSTKAIEVLEQRGFTNLHNVKEGVGGGDNGPGWQARQLPMVEWKQ